MDRNLKHNALYLFVACVIFAALMSMILSVREQVALNRELIAGQMEIMEQSQLVITSLVGLHGFKKEEANDNRGN